MLETVVTPGNVHDSMAFDDVYDKVTVRFPEVETVVADSAYKTPHICKYSGRRRPVPHNPSRYAAVPFSHKSWSEYKDGASDSLHIPVDCSCIPGIHPG